MACQNEPIIIPKTKKLSQTREISKKIRQNGPAFCPAYTYIKATRKPWREKTPNKSLTLTNYPGEWVLVDSFESATAGFTAQIKGILNNKRYRIVTIYIDHYSDLSYVFLQEDATNKETLRGYYAFKQYERKFGVSIEHYHADNGTP